MAGRYCFQDYSICLSPEYCLATSRCLRLIGLHRMFSYLDDAQLREEAAKALAQEQIMKPEQMVAALDAAFAAQVEANSVAWPGEKDK
jgi:hypothetical protein